LQVSVEKLTLIRLCEHTLIATDESEERGTVDG